MNDKENGMKPSFQHRPCNRLNYRGGTGFVPTLHRELTIGTVELLYVPEIRTRIQIQQKLVVEIYTGLNIVFMAHFHRSMHVFLG